MPRSSVVALALLASWACQSPAEPGATCARTSDCASPLVCRHGRCRVECREARDCPTGLRCYADASGLGACSLPPETTCTPMLACGSDLVCAGGECRTSCTDATGCGAGASCASGSCVAPVSGVDAGTRVDAGAADAGADAYARDAFVVLTDGGRAATGTGSACGDGGLGTDGGVCSGAYICTATARSGEQPACHLACADNPACYGEGAGSICGAACTTPCDPFANTGCGTDVCGIYPANAPEGEVSYTDCRANGGRTALEPCPNGESDCGPGLTCFRALCRWICHSDHPQPGGCTLSGDQCTVLRPLVGTMLTQFPFGACCPAAGC